MNGWWGQRQTNVVTHSVLPNLQRYTSRSCHLRQIVGNGFCERHREAEPPKLCLGTDRDDNTESSPDSANNFLSVYYYILHVYFNFKLYSSLETTHDLLELEYRVRRSYRRLCVPLGTARNRCAYRLRIHAGFNAGLWPWFWPIEEHYSWTIRSDWSHAAIAAMYVIVCTCGILSLALVVQLSTHQVLNHRCSSYGVSLCTRSTDWEWSSETRNVSKAHVLRTCRQMAFYPMVNHWDLHGLHLVLMLCSLTVLSVAQLY